ncbi:MAG: ABC transporter ATP-binding protein [Spirochaetes bacterium]|nr:ABC transporter ATP-binding protein [Spirochaetota bacterium]
MLTIENVSVYYGHICAVDNVSLAVKKGEVVAPIGSNGAGKSSLMKAVLGISRVKSGTIRFMGKDITSWPTSKIVASGISYIPEGGGVLPLMTIRENLLLGAIFNQSEINKNLDKVYSIFPVLKERQYQPASNLSGGQRQMCAIGRALMGTPKLLMMDEPSLGLAPKIVTEILNISRELVKDGPSILLAEQNAKKALDYSDRAYVFRTGNVVLNGNSNELLENHEIQQAYLGG